jgi:hypothetical protein
LQTQQQSAKSLLEEFIACEPQAQNEAKHDRNSVTDEHAAHAYADGNPEAVIGEAGP